LLVALLTGVPEAGLRILLGAAALGVIRARSGNAPAVHLRLTALRDVRLDTKSIRKVEPGRDAVPGTQFINTNLGPEIDVARIVLHVEGQSEPVRLTNAFLAHMDSMEWARKIRAFLRTHGWIPADERDDEDDEDDEEVDDEPDPDDDPATPRR
jgi:hypothetical protein